MIDFDRELNKEQLKVVYEGEGPCLVLSGPGSGKTRTLVYRAAYLLEKGVPSSRILLLTFTKKAAKEMLSRIYNLTTVPEKEICGGTFHHTGNFFLRKHAKEIGYNNNFTILDEEDSRNLLKDVINSKKGVDLPKAPIIKRIISLSLNSKKKIEDIIKREYSFLDENLISEILEISGMYQERKKKNNLMDYDDLLLNWNNILSIDDIRKNISEEFLYILIDEYQDTNALQNDIIKKISEKHRNLLVVGDDAQSIYSFRAASISNIINFTKEYPDSKTFKLETNYRSTPEILNIANLVIEKNTEKLEKTLKSVRRRGPEPQIISFSNPAEEAKHIVNYLKRHSDISEVAVLFRAHFHSVELEIELARAGIPYILRGGVRFFEQHHVKDVVSFLKIFLNFYDEVSWKRILLRQEGIGDVNSQKIIKEFFELGSIDNIFSKKEDVINKFSSKIIRSGVEKTISLALQGSKEDISAKINVFLSKFYNHYLDFSFENSKERKNDIKRLADISAKYNNLEEMIADFSLSEDFQKEEKGKNAVVLSTIHQAKGLEWETVFLISLKEGSFPHLKSLEEDLIEEERRLFYVAITRCKTNLFLTYPLYDFKRRESAQPSRFLKEINSSEGEIVEYLESDETEGEWENF